MPNRLLPKEIIAESIRNSRGTPFTPLAAFEAIGGPKFLEFLPDRLVTGRGSAPAAEVSEVSAATQSEK